MKRFSIITSILLLLCSCSQNIEQKIGERIEHNCRQNENCIIKIKDVTEFQWDKMFVFEYGARQDEIEKAIGVSYPNYVEFDRRLIFLKDGKIIHSENLPADVEKPINGEIIFDSRNADPRLYTPETANFKVEKRKFQEGNYYILTRADRFADGAL